ncbi:MAG TPA: GNAT family N-acetyltransferase [Ktedonobacterales bacterium]|jgi:ribosomal protein S18 acetylase RimI-like enzyme
MVNLRLMTQAEYDAFADPMWEDFTHDLARATGNSIEEARTGVAQQRATLLPDELHTPGHRFWIVEDPNHQRVGILWVQLRDARHEAFIYDIEMDAAARGKGYGRQTLEALEAEVRPLGITRISLNVFGGNATAVHLYQTSGFQTDSMQMHKDI